MPQKPVRRPRNCGSFLKNCRTVRGLVSTGDCSIPTAMRNGNIQKISHVNYEYKNYLGILQEGKVVVYGE